MPDVICNKCGNKIPGKAKFCPNCGSVKPEAPATPPSQPSPPQPAPTPPPSSPPPSGQGSFDTLFSKNFILMGTLLGILFALIGRIITTFTLGMANGAGQTINLLGFFAIGVFLIGGGIVNKNLDKYIKLGMIVGGAFAIGMGL